MRFFFMKKLDVESTKNILYSKTNFEIKEYLKKNPQAADSEEIALYLLKENSHFLKNLSRRIRDNESIVQIAFNKNQSCLKFASKRIQLLKKFTDAAMNNSEGNYESLLPSVKMRRDYVIAYLEKRWSPYEVPKKFFDKNKDVAKDYLSSHGDALKYMPKSIQDDPEMVKVAVLNNSQAYKFASKRLRNNKEMASFVVEYQPDALKYASSSLMMNRELALLAISKSGLLLNSLKTEKASFADDEVAVRLAIANDGRSISYASERIRENSDFCLMAVQNNILALQEIGIRHRYNPEILCVVLKDNLFKLNKHLTATSQEIRTNTLERLNALMKSKPQSYFLEAMKNACEYKVPRSNNAEFLPSSIKLILDYASTDTLKMMKKFKTENKILSDFIAETLDRMKILEIPKSKKSVELSEKEGVKKAKSRKVLKP